MAKAAAFTAAAIGQMSGRRRPRLPPTSRAVHHLQVSTNGYTLLTGRLVTASAIVPGGAVLVDGDRIAVVSQVSSTLWVGNLASSGWQVTGAGASYALPRHADGGILYGTAEGVSWIAPDQVVMVSDKAKPEQDRRCRAKDQSIHIFRIPESPPRPALRGELGRWRN